MSGIEHLCPCCGQKWPVGRSKEDAERLLREFMLHGPVQTKLVEHLLRNFGLWVPRRRLIEIAFVDDPDGGPDNANDYIAVTMNRIRHRVRKLGFEIDGKSYYGSRLRFK